ncbi:pyridoxal phosphate-dependent aminotransferase [Streptomyces sp. NPDC001889]
MADTPPEGHGPVRYGPGVPGTGLPVPGELAGVLAAAAGAPGEPPGGGAVLREAARGYWWRRGLHSAAEDLVAAAGPQPLLLALLGAYTGDDARGGDVLMSRPCPAWWAPQARLLGRGAYRVPTPAECGGVPDPFALLETVRRVRAEGGAPRVLLLSVADDPTGTVAPPETVRETCEAAVGEGLHIISDESWRDTVHRPRETVLVSPAEMCPGDVTVLSDLAGALLPPSWPAAVARFPPTAAGAAHRDRVLDFLAALGAAVAGPVAAAAAHALDEPGGLVGLRERGVEGYARVGAEVHRAVLACGGLARPPVAGRHLYADFGPLREGLGWCGVGDSMELEEYLSARLGVPVPGGHRFGDELGALRARLPTAPFLSAALLPHLTTTLTPHASNS